MPKIERKAAPPKQKKEKAKGVVQEATSAVAAAVEKVKEVVTGGVSVKEAPPKEKKEKAPKTKAAPAEGKKSGKSGVSGEEIGEPMPSMIDMRVGRIVESMYLRLTMR